MINNPLIKTLEFSYKDSFTLFDALKDPIIKDNTEKFYVPEPHSELQPNSSVFIKKDESIAITNDGPKRIKFIYLNYKGKNMTNPDSSYIQISPNCTGFLARLSISRNVYIPSSLNLDYFIDISKIKYRVDSVTMANDNQIIANDMIYFENLNLLEYPTIDFDIMLKEFNLHKEELFEMYF